MRKGHRRSNVSHILPTADSVQMEIKFDRHPPIYMAGEKLGGFLLLNIPNGSNSDEPDVNENNEQRTVAARDLKLTVLGDASNSWVSKTSDKIYESSESYLNQSFPLIERPTDFPAGHHELSFEIDLPHTLPSSYDSEYGRIKYTVSAAFYANTDEAPSLADRSDSYVERQFGVIAQLKLSAFPGTKQPVEAVDSTEYSCCCVPLGSVRAVITLPKNGFPANEPIPITATIFNGTRRKIKRFTVSLIQQASFVAWSRYEKAQDIKERQYCIASMERETILPQKSLDIEQEPLKLPFLIPTYFGSIITIGYLLRFEADPGLEITIPITIGTAE